MSLDLYRCTPRQVRGFIKDCAYAGLVPFVQSSPGMGKSSIMRSVAKELNLSLIDHRLSTSAPEDLSGLPTFLDKQAVNDEGVIRSWREAAFVPFADLFPLDTTPLVEGTQGWMLFLDEFNSASKSVQAASYKLILDKMTGQRKLHERVIITAAGNLATDRAIVNPISTAMQSRVVHLEMEINFDEWLYDVALAESYDSRVIAYLSQFPSKLMDFRPEHQDKTFCCPRTWEFVNRLIKGREHLPDVMASLLAGTITSGVAVDFVQFTKVFHNMVTIKEILANPETCRVPHDNGSKWAVISHMMEKVTPENFGDLCIYAGRFDIAFRVLFFRSVLVRNQNLRSHPNFIKALSELSRYLNG